MGRRASNCLFPGHRFRHRRNSIFKLASQGERGKFVSDSEGTCGRRKFACDGLLPATPEYNNGIPGVFKNAIDWMSRPAADLPLVFANRPVAVMGASPGGFGTLLAQNAWLPLPHTLRARPWFGGRLVAPRAGHVFNDAGELVDEAVRNQLREFVRGFARFIQSVGPRQEQAGRSSREIGRHSLRAGSQTECASRVTRLTGTAPQCSCSGAGVPSDHLPTGIRKTVSRPRVSLAPITGEPGVSAPQVVGSVSGRKNIR